MAGLGPNFRWPLPFRTSPEVSASQFLGRWPREIGERKAIILGALIYAAGLVLSSYCGDAGRAPDVQLADWLWRGRHRVGIILAVGGRAASDEHRSMAMAIATAVGSLGQMIGPPFAVLMLSMVTWQTTFVIFAGLIIATLASLPFMRSPQLANYDDANASMGQVLKMAFKDPSFTMIFLGFFSCGYQLAFVTAHFPALIAEMCGPIQAGGMLGNMGISSTSTLGAISISLIGVVPPPFVRGIAYGI